MVFWYLCIRPQRNASLIRDDDHLIACDMSMTGGHLRRGPLTRLLDTVF